MTKHERIRIHLSKIRYQATPGRVWSISDIVLAVQEELDAIKALLEDLDTPYRDNALLHNKLNAAEKKNYELNLMLSQYKAGWCPYDCATVEELAKLRSEIKQLKEELDAVTGSNEYLRGCNNRLEQNLRVLEEEIVKQVRQHEAELTAADRKSEYLERARSANDAYIQRLSDEIKNLKQGLDAATRSNASLRRLLQSKRGLLENSEAALRHVRDQLETILEQTKP